MSVVPAQEPHRVSVLQHGGGSAGAPAAAVPLPWAHGVAELSGALPGSTLMGQELRLQHSGSESPQQREGCPCTSPGHVGASLCRLQDGLRVVG